MRVRAAEPSELVLVTELTERAYARYTDTLGAPPIPVTEDYAPRIRAGEVWLLEDGATPLGVLVLKDKGESLEIFSVAVLPERQGEGIGRRLMTFAEEHARRRGRDMLTLFTNAKMVENIERYRRAGFEESGRRPNPLRPGWTLVDMHKSLMPSTDSGSA